MISVAPLLRSFDSEGVVTGTDGSDPAGRLKTCALVEGRTRCYLFSLA